MRLHFKIIYQLILFAPVSLIAQDKLSTLITDIQNGPSIYYTPQAVMWVFKNDPLIQSRLDENNNSQKQAIDAIRAALLLSDMGTEASGAIPALIEKFPRAVHVIYYKNMHFTSGNGTIEDWAYTYANTEKKKFIYNSPFLPMTLMEKGKSAIFTNVETVIASKQTGRGGKIVDAMVDVAITLSFYPGAFALSEITGNSLDTTSAVWRERVATPYSSGNSESLKATTSSWGDPTPVTGSASLAAPTVQATGSLTYSELMNSMPLSTSVSIAIKSGSVFKGVPLSVDADMVKLTVEDMIIPIARNIIISITRE